jgi:hypothetical protein
MLPAGIPVVCATSTKLIAAHLIGYDAAGHVNTFVSCSRDRCRGKTGGLRRTFGGDGQQFPGFIVILFTGISALLKKDGDNHG